MTTIPFILGSDSITVFHNSKSFTINKEARTYNGVVAAVKFGDTSALEALLEVKKSVFRQLSAASENVTMRDGQIFYKDRPVDSLLSSRIFEMLDMNVDLAPMSRFIENLMQNPSYRAVTELFGFLDACKLPITEDGHFLAYKRVRDDYKDVHSGTMDNSVGKIVEMPRNLVNEDKNQTCSSGLHFCSYDYLQHFSGDRIVVLKINPADVVSIPTDYNNSKGRTCRYLVIDELPLNEYKMPEKELDDFYTDRYNAQDTDDHDEHFDVDYDYLEEDEEEVQVEVPSKVTSAKLSVSDVVEIKRLLKKQWTVASIANNYGVSERQIRRIRDGEAWKDVE